MPSTREKKVSTHTYDKTKRGRGGISDSTSEQVLDGVASLEPCRGAFFPPGDGTPFWVHESLLEDMVEDILEIDQGRPVADVNELCGHRPLRARRLVVGDPELTGRTAVGKGRTAVCMGKIAMRMGRTAVCSGRTAVCRNSHIVVESERRECARKRGERMGKW